MSYKIGVLVSGIQDDYSKMLCSGMMRRAKLLGVNIVIIPGKYIDRDIIDSKIKYEYQYNTLFDLINKQNIDGLVIAADCIGCFSNGKSIGKFLDKFEGIPCVLAVSRYKNYSCVNFDNKSGLGDALSYLMDRLGYTKVCMIGASMRISDAYERKQVYLKALEDRGIPFEDRYYVEGNQTSTTVEVFRKILDDNPDAQVIVCQNDETARGLYDEMQKRGLIPGKDIDVLGFDNTEWSESSFPALSSISANAVSIGEECISLLVKKLDGEVVQNVEIPTSFIRRESIKAVDYKEENGKKKWTVQEDFRFLFYRCANQLNNDEYNSILAKFVDACEMASNYVQGNIKEFSRNVFEEFYSNENIKYLDIGRYNIYINQISNYYMSLGLDDVAMGRVFEVINLMNARILRSVNHYMGNLKSEHDELNFAMKNFARETLDFENGADSSYISMLNDLSWLGVKNAFVFMLKEPVIHESDDIFEPPTGLLLKARLRDGKIETLQSMEQVISVSDIFSEEFVGIKGNYSMALLPLYFNEVLYGYFMCEATQALFMDGDFIVAQLSSAARVIDLLKKFDGLSKMDKLTGLMNRRGFEADAKELYEYAKKNAICMVALYFDMNSLKVINDKFGHEGGDFALTTIGAILKQTLESRGVVGRIGGDEFVALITVRPDTSCETIEKIIYQEFKEFNTSCDKPYNVMISIGSYFIDQTCDLTFEEAMKKADEKMYVVKQNKENVLK